MIFAILALLGIPLWFLAIAMVTLVFRNRDLRHRPGNVGVRLQKPGKRWKRGHAVWVHDGLCLSRFAGGVGGGS
jgi:hypothetical protein